MWDFYFKRERAEERKTCNSEDQKHKYAQPFKQLFQALLASLQAASNGLEHHRKGLWMPYRWSAHIIPQFKAFSFAGQLYYKTPFFFAPNWTNELFIIHVFPLKLKKKPSVPKFYWLNSDRFSELNLENHTRSKIFSRHFSFPYIFISPACYFLTD